MTLEFHLHLCVSRMFMDVFHVHLYGFILLVDVHYVVCFYNGLVDGGMIVPSGAILCIVCPI